MGVAPVPQSTDVLSRKMEGWFSFQNFAPSVRFLGNYYCFLFNFGFAGTSLVVQWLRHFAPSVLGSPNLIPGQNTRSCMHADRVSDPMDCSLPGSSVQGILQAGILEGIAMAFSGLGLE